MALTGREMANKTKAQLFGDISRLEAEVAALKKKLSAVEHREITGGRFDNTRYLAFPLKREELEVVEPMIGDRVSELAGEGEVVQEFEDVGTTVYELVTSASRWSSSEEPLPQFHSYFVRYSYNRQNGTQVEQIWGLRKI